MSRARASKARAIVPTPRPPLVRAIFPGAKVRVTAGASENITGRVVELSPLRWAGSIRMWVVDLTDILVGRTIREDYLEAIDG